MANNMQNIDNPVIGVDLLGMLMLHLYSNPRCIYREYLQNALDSINDAVKCGVLKQVKDGRVSINISKDDITIEDNGTGISSDKAVKYLTDIANSFKDGVDTAGLYGVGRLSGGGYCELLEFETTYTGENVATIVSIDTKILRQLIEKKATEISAEKAMRDICSTQTIPAKPEEHKFIVRLKRVINSRDILLDVEEIKNYIAEYAPVDYSVLFNSLINNNKQLDFVKRHKEIDKIRVSLNDHADIEKKYGVTILGTGDPIEKLRYFELPKHPIYGNLGWGWYAVTEFSVQINEEKDSCAGIRLRKHNISLDKNILNPYFKESRGYKYFYGEIFITNDKIVPDSGRQGLAAGEEAEALISEIRSFFTNVLHNVYHRANNLKKPLDDMREVVEKLNDPTMADAIKPLTKKLQDHFDKFKKYSTKCGIDEINDVISIYVSKYDSELKKEVDGFLVPQQEQKQPVVEPDFLDFVLASSQSEPTKQDLPSEQTNKNNTGTTPQKKHITTPEQTTPASPIVVIPKQKVLDNKQPKSKVDEILSGLDSKGYSQEQIALLKRVFSTMLVVCSSSNKKNVVLLMEAAVNSL